MPLGQKIKGGAAALVASGVLVLASAGVMDFLGRWEGQGQQVVYADRLARGLPTVCKGVTKHTSPYPVVVGDYWSPERCEQVERL
ncbi:lysozyme, partial [Bordetella bronchiseptica]